MNGVYTLKSGKKISVFLWDDLLEGETFRGTADVRAIKEDGYYSSKECKKKLFKDDTGVYIVWDSQKVYINSYDYMSADTLVSKLAEGVEKEDRWFVRDEEIWATLMHESDKIGILCELPMYDMLIPSMGIGMTSDKYVEVLCVFSEHRYKKDKWSYKVTLVPENEKLQEYVASRHFYFSDFCSMLQSGHMRFVLKDEYKVEIEKARQEKEIEDSKFVNRVKNMFSREKKATHNILVV